MGTGGEADLGRQGISQTLLELQLGEQLVGGPSGDGGIDVRVLEDGAHGAYEHVGVEHGPVGPYDGGGQQDQQAGKGDQDADDRSAEPPLPGGLQLVDLLGQRVPLCSEAFDVRRRSLFGWLVPRTAIRVAHLVPTLRQLAPLWWIYPLLSRHECSA